MTKELKGWTHKSDNVEELPARIEELKGMGNHSCADSLLAMHSKELMQFVKDNTWRPIAELKDCEGEILGYGICEYEIGGTGEAPEMAVVDARSHFLTSIDAYCVSMSPTHFKHITLPKENADA
jgi:hypothetical protein